MRVTVSEDGPGRNSSTFHFSGFTGPTFSRGGRSGRSSRAAVAWDVDSADALCAWGPQAREKSPIERRGIVREIRIVESSIPYQVRVSWLLHFIGRIAEMLHQGCRM